MRIGIARTQPAFQEQAEVREVEQLYLDMIGTARHWIYAENQFLTSQTLARRLIQRLLEVPGLEVLIVAPKTHHTWLEHRTMLAGRIRFMQIIREAGLEGRVRLLYPHIRRQSAASEVMVHSKLMIVDDQLLRIGSANLCNRSMGTDTECDLVIEAASDADRAGILLVRNRLIGEHCGATPDEVATQVERSGSLLKAVNALGRSNRRLRPIRDRRLAAIQTTPAIEAAADPHRPIKASEFLSDFSGYRPPRSPVPVLVRTCLLVLSFTMLTLAWRYTPLSSLLDSQALQTAFSAGGHWGPVLALGLFLILGFLAFPVNILIIATAAAFGIWPGFLYASAGALISATVTYIAGRKVGPELLRSLLGPRINRINQKITKSGIIAITMVRMMPIAPFTLINLIAGAMRIRFSDYIIGTGLGLLPGIFLLSALGDRLSQILERPSLLNTLALMTILLMWISLIWLLQKFASRTRGEGAFNR